MVTFGGMKRLPLCRGAIAAAVLGLLARRASQGSRSIFRSFTEVWSRQREDSAGLEECRGVLLGGYPSRGRRGSVRNEISVVDQDHAANSLDAENLVRTWMRGWKQLSKSKAVTVNIEWRDIEIAKGETTLLSGDKVTIHR